MWSEIVIENNTIILCSGKILQDDTTLDTYNIDDKKFLVIMVTKPKAAPPSGPSDPTAAAAAAQPDDTIDDPPAAQEPSQPSVQVNNTCNGINTGYL